MPSRKPLSLLGVGAAILSTLHEFFDFLGSFVIEHIIADLFDILFRRRVVAVTVGGHRFGDCVGSRRFALCR